MAQIDALLHGTMSLATCASAIAAAAPGRDQTTMLAACFRTVGFPEFVGVLVAIRDHVGIGGATGPLSRLLRCLRPQEDLKDLAQATPNSAPSRYGPGSSGFWVDHALADLARWNSDRKWFYGHRNQAVIGSEFDFLQEPPRAISVMPSARLENLIARYCSKSRYDVCAIATARNEGLYLLEWLAHHQSLGVQAFFIYSNDNDDGSDALLRRLGEAGVIYYLRSVVGSKTLPQYKAYGHALSVLPNILDYRWSLILDIDEFLLLDHHQFAALSDFLAFHDQQENNAICLNWVIMGPSGQAKWSADFQRHRFPHRAGQDRHIKCLFRPHHFSHSHAHYPCAVQTMPIDIRDSQGYCHVNYYIEGREAAFSEPQADEVAWINHYLYKSAEEFLWRRWRNSGGQSVRARRLDSAFIADFMEQYRPSSRRNSNKITSQPEVFGQCY